MSEAGLKTWEIATLLVWVFIMGGGPMLIFHYIDKWRGK